MIADHCDSRPRVFIDRTPDGSATWKRHPAGKGEPALSPGSALDAFIEATGAGDVVAIVGSQQ
jgi:hypothetical protein